MNGPARRSYWWLSAYVISTDLNNMLLMGSKATTHWHTNDTKILVFHCSLLHSCQSDTRVQMNEAPTCVLSALWRLIRTTWLNYIKYVFRIRPIWDFLIICYDPSATPYFYVLKYPYMYYIWSRNPTCRIDKNTLTAPECCCHVTLAQGFY